MNPVWKQLRDNRWANGKLLWHAGPMFERSSDGVVVAVDNSFANWRDEVKRRVELDNSLPERLAQFAAAKAEEARDIKLSFMRDGSDIYDWLVINDDPGDNEYYAHSGIAIINTLRGRVSELELALSLASRAAEGGVQFAAEFVQNRENNLLIDVGVEQADLYRCRQQVRSRVRTELFTLANWRDEVKRRVELDNSLSELAEQLNALKKLKKSLEE